MAAAQHCRSSASGVQVIKGLSADALDQLLEGVDAPAELLELCRDSSVWNEHHRAVNHKASFTTTHVSGKGFGVPRSPCTLNLAGQVRPASCACPPLRAPCKCELCSRE